MIHLQDVNKTYYGAQPLHVLKGINLGIDRGEFVSIMGASGSGKSTLLNILGILDNYDTGEYYIDGRLIKNMSGYAKVTFEYYGDSTRLHFETYYGADNQRTMATRAAQQFAVLSAEWRVIGIGSDGIRARLLLREWCGKFNDA